MRFSTNRNQIYALNLRRARLATCGIKTIKFRISISKDHTHLIKTREKLPKHDLYVLLFTNLR